LSITGRSPSTSTTLTTQHSLLILVLPRIELRLTEDGDRTTMD